jgi:hypothetical protein
MNDIFQIRIDEPDTFIGLCITMNMIIGFCAPFFLTKLDLLNSSQGCLNGCPSVKFIIWTSAHVRNYPADAFLPMAWFLPSAPTIKNASARAQARPRGRAHASARTQARPCGRNDASVWT